MLSEAMIRQLATAQSFQRGAAYYDEGAVLRIARRGETVRAAVAGSEFEPYDVQVTLGPTGVAATDCSCPYDQGGACKHIVAVLLTCLRQPERVEERPTVEHLLADLDAATLRALLTEAADDDPELADWLEAQVAAQAAPSAAGEAEPAAAPRQRRPPVDTSSYRATARAALRAVDWRHSSEAYRQTAGAVRQVRELAEQARPFLEAGDGENALRILEAVTDEYVGGCDSLDDSDGDVSGLFEELGELWTEVLLSADLSADERQKWAERLAEWQGKMDFSEGELEAARTAALQGWDDPQLVRALRGELTLSEVPTAEPVLSDERLISGRLVVLARQGRTTEYLNLARVAGRVTEYATMLARVGRSQEAVDYGLARLTETSAVLELAKALHAAGAVSEALRVAEHGLGLTDPSSRYSSLPAWLRDQAAAAGQTELARRAALATLQQGPRLEPYLAAERVYGDAWPPLRARLLADLRQPATPDPWGSVEILLHEGLLDDAIAIADAHTYSYRLAEKVAEAVITSHPGWVMAVGQREAERIAAAARAKSYPEAAAWLERARRAAEHAGRLPEWRSGVELLKSSHRRKSSLVPLLDELLARRGGG